mmetsp:Transcript_103470/g.316749  ORF Transcript_103470/g.316749 Transcript_103470/m.316749 type:complete len:230 (-) Transcript_103470:1011-1700(-)
MFTQNTSFACCGMFASHVGELGCPTKRPSSEYANRSTAALKPSSGTVAKGPDMSSSPHQCSAITNLASISIEKGPRSSADKALRNTTVSTEASLPSKPSTSSLTPNSAFSTASRIDPSTSCTTSQFPKASFASWRRALTSRPMKVRTQSNTLLGSMSVSASCLRSKKFICQRRVMMRVSKSCTASPTSSVNSCNCNWPRSCNAVKRPSSCRGTASNKASMSIEPSATCK